MSRGGPGPASRRRRGQRTGLSTAGRAGPGHPVTLCWASHILLNINPNWGGGGKIHHATQNLVKRARVRTIVKLFINKTILLDTVLVITNILMSHSKFKIKTV